MKYFQLISLIIFIENIRAQSFPQYDQCHEPLGMESGIIPDGDISSSSSHDSSSVGPQMARIRTELEGGAWCPDKQIGPGIYEYIQITLPQLSYITMVETQGRFGNGQGKEYTEWYQVQYQRIDNEEWFTYRTKNNKTILSGNINTYLAEKYSITNPILAKRIRNLFFLGGVVAYSAPPSTRFTDVKLEDDTYDGTRSNALWFGGVGKLVDGIIGEVTSSNKQLSSDWVGWNRHQVGSFIVLQFYFDISRHFKSINIYSHSQSASSSSLPYQSVNVTMYKLSNNSKEYTDLIQWTHAPSLATKKGINIDNITCKITSKLITKVDLKFQLTNDNDWLFLTEIIFDNSIDTTSTKISTSLCGDVFCYNILACVSATSINQTNLLQTSSSFKTTTLFGVKWIVLVSSAIIVCFLLLILLIFLRFNPLHRQSYYKKSQQHQHSTLKELEALTENQTINTYDDVSSDIVTLPSSIKTQSMGSYIYPITSTSSVGSHFLPSPNNSSKENYAVIDTYCFNQCGDGGGETSTASLSDNSGTQQTSLYSDWSKLNLNNNSTFHYASSDITQEFLTDDVFPNIQGLFGTNLFRSLNNTYFNTTSKQIQSNVKENKLYALKKISESTNGEIYSGKYDDECANNVNKSVLIKIVKPTSTTLCRQSFINEFNLLLTLSHPNIIRLCGVQNEYMYLIQEHGDSGTLKDYYQTLTAAKSTINDQSIQTMNYYFAYQLSSGLNYLYHCGIVHGDIATRNCLFYQDYTIKLSDHAMVLQKYSVEYWQCRNKKIPLRWMPPDAVSCLTFKSDVYSFGVCLWEIWNHCHLLPHSSLSNYELYLKFCQINKQATNELNTLNLPLPPDCPKEIYDLLCECWNCEQDKRPQISDIYIYFRRQMDGCVM
ncbi:unnamed protein product [Didymodactylos carnosus]|uniref:Uncharacterized protein n=1 Tax=Didymodactylos carnosus TaxID=1234261 RepID=A0A8S2E6S3_9BILA|nr:unnamed protein product [Didymodactylos carnosus]CAF3854754.1 unnamed protein product [Didymodactylos carnosus]